MSHKDAAEFVGVLLHSSTAAHFLHLQTASYAAHKALGHYYQNIIGLADKYAEAYQGRYGLIAGYDNAAFHYSKEPKMYVGKMLDFLDEIKGVLPKDTDLVNLFDAVVDAVTSLKYKLENLS